MPGGNTAPQGAKFVGAQILWGGAALLHMNDEAAVSWLKANMDDFLRHMGGTSVYKECLCNVVLQYVPVTFDPTAKGALEVVGNDNSLPRGVLTKARWIKPLERRREGQRVAHTIFGSSDPWAANTAIREGL
ncbi:hypothetical protein DFH08DRAFT_698719 [Mycena albidolilacea]|uniref:Uncharacterized protein n=1 Tax=Mycena albidolilacea TaxID=1033008 RepID=A0AAD7A2W1_9AGAR|nr:hypothetical protein DFH08DRAFT_698719 [Mycena albidolilacea]